MTGAPVPEPVQPAPRRWRVLCVDDEPVMLGFLARCLNEEFDVFTAENGFAGLEALTREGPFAAIVSDLAMPRMSGAEFLSQALARAPDATRVLLTACTEVGIAAAAVNAGQVHRFVTKPADSYSIQLAVRDAVVRYQVVMAEREVLEQTLQRSAQVLVQLLALLQPAAFGRSERLAEYVQHMAASLQLPGAWKFELAARLSQLGFVALPPEIVAKVHAGQELTQGEHEILSFHPCLAHQLLAGIPRLEAVAEMILHQDDGQVAAAARTVNAWPEDEVGLGAQMLSLALELDVGVTHGRSARAMLGELRSSHRYDPRLVTACDGLTAKKEASLHRLVSPRELEAGMTLDEDIRSSRGTLLIARGQEVTEVTMRRLIQMEEEREIHNPFRVLLRRAA